MRINRYTEAYRDQWENFVFSSKNGTFILTRNFIDYHKQKFNDHSLLAFDGNELVGVIPMNESGDEVYSHQGLTYGGWVLSPRIKLHEFVMVFKVFLDYLVKQGFTVLYYKPIPFVYHSVPAQEDLQILYLLGAKCIAQHINPVIIPSTVPTFQDRRIRGVKKARNAGIQISISEDLLNYFKIVKELLRGYGTTPVHSIEEIVELKKKFPDHVVLHAAFIGSTMCAGVLCFETVNCVRFQYIASTQEGRDKGALDLLFYSLIQESYSQKKYLDFGTSTIDQGNQLVLGISVQKEGFGARTTIQPIYSLSLNCTNWDALNTFVI